MQNQARGSAELQRLIGLNFRWRRMELKLAQTEIAPLLHYSTDWIIQVEAGRTSPDLSLAEILKDVLQVDEIDYLFQERDWEQMPQRLEKRY